MEKVKPIKITIEDKQYTLEFNRDTVSEAEAAGFKRTDAEDKMMLRTRELFYFAFKMHHPEMTQEETDKILFDELGGMSSAMLERLIGLYSFPYDTLINESGKPKNAKVTVSL